MSPFGDPWFTGIGLAILGCFIGAGLWATRIWAVMQGFVCAATALAVVAIMAVQSGNLSTEVHWNSDGRYASANAVSFWLFSVPVLILIAVAVIRLRQLPRR